jgi:hypothetical protein
MLLVDGKPERVVVFEDGIEVFVDHLQED